MVTMIVILGIFALLIGLMPSDLYAYQVDYDSPLTQDQEVVDYFNAHNITLYENTWQFYIVADDVATNQSSLPDGESVEFHFYEADTGVCFIQLRHAKFEWGGLFVSWHPIEPLEPYRSDMGYDPTFHADRPGGGIGPDYTHIITKENVLAIVDGNSTYFESGCGHITQNFVLLPYNTSYSGLENSWDNNRLFVYSSYGVDFDAMKPSAWLLVAQLITFQNPDFGVPGDFGTVFNYGFAIGFWIVIAIIIYTLVTRVIPTIRGGLED